METKWNGWWKENKMKMKSVRIKKKYYEEKKKKRKSHFRKATVVRT